jgi:putative oxidoreductase
MALETLTGGAAFLAARVLFGGVLAFMGLNHFLDAESMAGYAEFKGLPAPKLSVYASGALLVAGGAGIVAGVFPVVSAAAIAAFLAISAVTMHDFWRVEDPEDRQAEMTDFLKNAALVGGALTLVAVGGTEWPLALGVGL